MPVWYRRRKAPQGPYHGDPKHYDEEFSMKLTGFTSVSPPLTATELKEMTGNPGIVFRQTMVNLDPASGTKVLAGLEARKASA
jgi:hypothetical protein